jgi:hypothetical protein
VLKTNLQRVCRQSCSVLSYWRSTVQHRHEEARRACCNGGVLIHCHSFALARSFTCLPQQLRLDVAVAASPAWPRGWRLPRTAPNHLPTPPVQTLAPLEPAARSAASRCCQSLARPDVGLRLRKSLARTMRGCGGLSCVSPRRNPSWQLRGARHSACQKRVAFSQISLCLNSKSQACLGKHSGFLV